MHTFNLVLQSVVALLGIGVVGFWIIKRRIIPENVLGFLATLAIDIALPSVVFANIMLYFSPAASPNWWQLPLWWLVFSAASLLLTVLVSLVSAQNTRSEFALSLFFQNAIFFPLIILNGIVGRDTPYTAQLFIFGISHPTLYFSTYHLFFRNRQRTQDRERAETGPGGPDSGDGRPAARRRLIWRRIVNPVLVATCAAVAIRLSGAERYIPSFLVTIFQLLGGMTLPLLMLILGGSLYLDFQKKGPIYFAEMLKFVLAKNVIFPLVFLALLLLVRPDYNVALMVMLQSAVPPISGIPIMTEREGGNVAITNQFILASFVFSVVSIPAAFLLFSRFFPMP